MGPSEATSTPGFGSSRVVRSCYAELFLPKVSRTSGPLQVSAPPLPDHIHTPVARSVVPNEWLTC